MEFEYFSGRWGYLVLVMVEMATFFFSPNSSVLSPSQRAFSPLRYVVIYQRGWLLFCVPEQCCFPLKPVRSVSLATVALFWRVYSQAINNDCLADPVSGLSRHIVQTVTPAKGRSCDRSCDSRFWSAGSTYLILWRTCRRGESCCNVPGPGCTDNSSGC